MCSMIQPLNRLTLLDLRGREQWHFSPLGVKIILFHMAPTRVARLMDLELTEKFVDEFLG